jgi:HlyD family secretion protein
MDVTVEIDLPARTNVLMVPDGALTFAPQGQRAGTNVYLLGSDNQPRQIPVAVEASDGKRTEVVANGLEPGAQVITGWRHSPGVQSAGGTPRRKP